MAKIRAKMARVFLPSSLRCKLAHILRVLTLLRTRQKRHFKKLKFFEMSFLGGMYDFLR